MNRLVNILRSLFTPQYNSVLLCRLIVRLHKRKYKILRLFFSNRLTHKYGMFVGRDCVLGANIKFPHPNGIIIGNRVVIGDNCTVYQQVTFGKRKGDLDKKADYPIIGDNVTIFAGAKIIGGVKVGNNSVIGANSVVLADVEPDCIYAGIPAKKIKNN